MTRSATAVEKDHALVLRAQRELPARSQAFEELVQRHRAAVLARATRILRVREEAEDVVQEVFLNVFRALPRYVPEQPFEHWLARIVTNACRMQLRRRSRDLRKRAAVEAEHTRPARVDPSSGLEATRLIDRLSEPGRSALLLRVTDHRYLEIADRLGISESAAKMRVKRAREQARSMAGSFS